MLNPISERRETPDPSWGPTEFARELGLEDGAAASELFTASGGNPVLGRAAVSALAAAAAAEEETGERPIAPDVSSPSFADYVARLVAGIDLGVTTADARQAAVLAHLSVFTRQTALMVVSVVGERFDEGLGLRDPEGVLMRLRMARLLIPADTGADRRYYRIPSLIAGCLRLETTQRPDAGDLVVSLIDALCAHLENTHVIDAHILDDALTLSRAFGQWQQLVRLQESVGLPMFLIAPRAACSAYGHLPGHALAAVADLDLFSALSDDVLDRLANGSSGEDIRAIVIEDTGAGRMRAAFPGVFDVPRGSSAAGESSAVAPSRADSGSDDFVPVLRRMISSLEAGDHQEAATLGLAWSEGNHGRWARLLVRLLTAIGLFHCRRFGRSVSVLNEIESEAADGYVDGDFLLPAATAWTALASLVSGDHERADRCLAGLDELRRSPLLVEELTRPAAHVAMALRALDRLDVETAGVELEQLATYPDNRALPAYPPAISRTIAVLTASNESSLLFANDDVEKYQAPMPMSVTGRDLLAASRAMVFIALGQLKWAEIELERMSQTSDVRIVAKVRVELIAGRLDNAVSMAEAWFYHASLTPVRRAELAAIKAAALLRLGRRGEAEAEFVTAVGLSTWVSSLLPVAMLPQGDRNHLIDLTAGHEVWSDAFTTFSPGFRDFGDFLRRLRSLGAAAVDRAATPQLSAGESQLLDLLARGLSISELSEELEQVTGTVKNRLSALYRKFGVSNRSDLLTRATSWGFLRS